MSDKRKYLEENDLRLIVRYHRNMKRMSRNELANIVGVHYQLIFKFETGQSSISVEKLVEILRVLGLNIYIYDYEFGVIYKKDGCVCYRDIIDNIVFYRKERKLSRKKLADSSSLSEMTVMKCEKGTVLSIKNLLKILKTLSLRIILLDKATCDLTK